MYDAIIVGAGPAGLSAALVLGRARRRVAVFDSGTPRNGASRAIHAFLGHEGIAPHTLRQRGRDEAAGYGVEFYNEPIRTAERLPAGKRPAPTCPAPAAFRLTTESGRELACRKLLLATGVLDVLPEIPGLRECYGISVHHCPYCDGWEHRDQRLVAIGAEAEKVAKLALMLREWSSQVLAITSGTRLKDDLRERLAEHGIEHWHAPIKRVAGESGRVRAIELRGDAGTVAADAIFFTSGQRPQSDLATQLDCPFEDAAHVRSGHKQKADCQGLFLAGDVDGDTQLAIVAAAEGAIAAVAMHRELLQEDRA